MHFTFAPKSAAALAVAPRITADPAALAYLERNIIFTGRLTVPVLTMHTTGDGLMVPENEHAYRSVAAAAGDVGLLRQIFAQRAGHCAFTPAETITAPRELLDRLNTGRWGNGLRPAMLNADAAALGPTYNIFGIGPMVPVPTNVVPEPPDFVQYRPALSASLRRQGCPGRRCQPCVAEIG